MPTESTISKHVDSHFVIERVGRGGNTLCVEVSALCCRIRGIETFHVASAQVGVGVDVASFDVVSRSQRDTDGRKTKPGC